MCSYPLARKILYVSIKLCSPILKRREWKEWELSNLGYSKEWVRLHSRVGVNVYLLKDLMFSSTPHVFFFLKKKRKETVMNFLRSSAVQFHWDQWCLSAWTLQNLLYLISTVSEVKLFYNFLLLFLIQAWRQMIDRIAIRLKHCKSHQDSLWAKINAVPFRRFRVRMLFILLSNQLLIFLNHVIAESSGAFFKITKLCNSECCLHSGLPGGTVWFVLPSLH